MVPKLLKIFLNLVRNGFRVTARTAVTLFRSTYLIKIAMVSVMIFFDVFLYAKGLISKTQLIKNTLLGIVLAITGVIGWNLGTGWLAIEFVGELLVSMTLVGIGTKSTELLFDKFWQDDKAFAKCKIEEHEIDPKTCEKVCKDLTYKDIRVIYKSKGESQIVKEIIEKHRPPLSNTNPFSNNLNVS